MLLFLLLLLPLSLIIYMLYTKNSKNILVILMGLTAAVLVSLYKVFISSSHRLIPYSFGQNFIYYLCIQSFIPVLVLYGIFLIFVKDDWEMKIKSFFPLEATFFAVFLPYCIISSSTVTYTAWALFLKPSLYLSMLIMQAFSLYYLYRSITDKKMIFTVLSALVFLIYSLVPSLLEAAYVIKGNYAVIGIFSAFYIVLSIGAAVYYFIKSKLVNIA